MGLGVASGGVVASLGPLQVLLLTRVVAAWWTLVPRVTARLSTQSPSTQPWPLSSATRLCSHRGTHLSRGQLSCSRTRWACTHAHTIRTSVRASVQASERACTRVHVDGRVSAQQESDLSEFFGSVMQSARSVNAPSDTQTRHPFAIPRTCMQRRW
jgi:hypothetical protein